MLFIYYFITDNVLAIHQKKEPRLFTLPYSSYAIRLRLENNAPVSRFPGATIRGGFGYTLRRIVCADFSALCGSCPARFSCVYAILLEPSLPPDMIDLKKAAYLPRPLALRPVVKDGIIDLSVVFFGKAHVYVPTIALCLDKMGLQGIGATKSRYKIDDISCLNVPIDPASFDPASVKPLTLEVSPAPPNRGEALIRLMTPLSLRRESKLVYAFDKDLFFHGLMRRMEMLCMLYGTVKDKAEDRTALLAAADTLECEADIQPFTQSRYSTRRQTRLDYSGIIGTVKLSGDVGRIMPLLRAGEIVGVGSNTVFGNGAYRLEAA